MRPDRVGLEVVLRVVAILGLCHLSGVPVLGQSYQLRGHLGAHDPSTVVKCKDRYYLFATGQGITSRSSADKIFWTAGQRVFTNRPAWTTNAVPGFTGTFWAPDVLHVSNRYCLYYSVSTFGSQVSAIGLVTNPTLDPTDPAFQWTDQGPVIISTNGSAYNTIDPCLAWDDSGKLWLCFGSYWNGIYLTQLDPATGLRITTNSPTYRLADSGSIEAAYIFRSGGYYYLFCNWGSCCDGVDSTYNIRVGRSPSITGPYLDKHGVDMVNGGGTLFMRASGKYSGLGHVGILSEGGTLFLTHHYYDANSWDSGYNAYGTPRFGMLPLSWAADGWPVCDNSWSAIYHFQSDARDENGQFSGLLQVGASFKTDPTYGHVLDLSGTNQHVWLPPGVGYAQTFATVVKWRGGGQWQRIFDFGTDTSKTVMLTPSANGNVMRFDINPGGNLQTLQWNQPLPTNVWTHVAVTLDGGKGILYVNGAAVATNSSMTVLPLSVAPQTNHLGRSKFAVDPYFNGQYASFRAYSRALTAAEIVAPVPDIDSPTDGSACWPGGMIRFAGNARDFMNESLVASNLTWQVHYINGGVTNVVMSPVTGTNEGAYGVPVNVTNGLYRVSLTATDNLGRKATNVVNVYAAATVGSNVWSSFYPLTSNALDASNNFNGTLVNGASFVSDPTRGNVLNLTSSSQQYDRLPSGAGAAQTVSGWIKWNGGGNWQRIFDFGQNNNCYFMLTPSDSSNLPQCAITADRATYSQVIKSPVAMPANQWTHVAVTMNGREGIFYLNGDAVAVNNSVNLLPSDVTGVNCSFGKSQYSADPYFSGRLSAMRLDSKVLTRAELVAPQPTILQPSNTSRFAGGTSLAFAGVARDYSGAFLPVSAFSWSGSVHSNGLSHVAFGPWTGITNGSYLVPTNATKATNVFYRISLTVTDTNDIQQTVSADVQPRTSVLSFVTVPAGLNITLDGQSLASPTSVVAVAGMGLTVGVPSPQLQAGTNYSFVLWSDGGGQSHSIAVPNINSSYTASFMQPTVAIAPGGEGFDLLWPAWAAPMTLEFTTNLMPPVVWSELGSPPTPISGMLGVHVAITNDSQFYRLRLP
jgi:hypothetical protein